MAELAGPQVLACICAVAGDVALAKGVAPENVVDASNHGFVETLVSRELGSGSNYDKVIEDAAVGAPRPAVGRRVRLAPRLLLLQLQHLQRSLYHAVNDLIMVGQANAAQGEIEAGRSSRPVEVEAASIEDIGGVPRGVEDFAAETVFTSRQPQLAGGPVEVAGQLGIAVRPAAEATLIIGG